MNQLDLVEPVDCFGQGAVITDLVANRGLDAGPRPAPRYTE